MYFLRLSRVFSSFAVKTPHSDHNGGSVEAFRDGTRPGEACQIIRQPQPRAGKVQPADGLGVIRPQPEAGDHHGHRGKQRKPAFPSGDTASCGNSREHVGPKSVGPARSRPFLGIHKASCRPDQVHRHAGIGTQQPEVQRPYQGRKHLQKGNAFPFVLLKGNERQGHSHKAHSLGDIKGHKEIRPYQKLRGIILHREEKCKREKNICAFSKKSFGCLADFRYV